MIKVKIHTVSVLKRIVGQGELEVSLPKGSTLKALLSWMVTTWGEKISSYLFDPGSASPIPHIRLVINGQDIGFLKGMDTVLQDGDVILIIPPVAGGKCSRA
ncbi:MAG: MoaD family protein [Proteobacteria bacterium]|nr:MoaD family protein [Pseudomonadota bacterium]NIS72310.1 MoaD family protein [Pseudomonadota bacterium]